MRRIFIDPGLQAMLLDLLPTFLAMIVLLFAAPGFYGFEAAALGFTSTYFTVFFERTWLTGLRFGSLLGLLFGRFEIASLVLGPFTVAETSCVRPNIFSFAFSSHDITP
jgi:hypothetical protein